MFAHVCPPWLFAPICRRASDRAMDRCDVKSTSASSREASVLCASLFAAIGLFGTIGGLVGQLVDTRSELQHARNEKSTLQMKQRQHEKELRASRQRMEHSMQQQLVQRMEATDTAMAMACPHHSRRCRCSRRARRRHVADVGARHGEFGRAQAGDHLAGRVRRDAARRDEESQEHRKLALHGDRRCPRVI
mgnify:CR=1 FL=1